MRNSNSNIAYIAMMLALLQEQSEEEGLLLETEQERQERINKAQDRRCQAKGLTQFFYGENSVWALNQKTADKKARKNKWIE
jgi:hypothetical protein